jgi:hypothetical protein
MLHHWYAAPGEKIDAASAPILLYSKPKNFEGIKVIVKFDILFSSDSS